MSETKVFDLTNLQTLFPKRNEERLSPKTRYKYLQSFIYHDCWENHSQLKTLFMLSFFGFYFLDKNEFSFSKDELYRKVEAHYEKNRAILEEDLTEEERNKPISERIEKYIEEWRKGMLLTEAGTLDLPDGRVNLFRVSSGLKTVLNDIRRKLTERQQGRFFGTGDKPVLLSYLEDHIDKFNIDITEEDILKKQAINQKRQAELAEEETYLNQCLEKIRQGNHIDSETILDNEVFQFFLGLDEELIRREENAEYIEQDWKRIIENLLLEARKSDVSRGKAILKSFQEDDLLKNTPESKEIERLKLLIPRNIFDDKEALEQFKAMLTIIYNNPIVQELASQGKIKPKKYYLDFILKVLPDRIGRIDRIKEKGLNKINNIITNFTQLQGAFGQELKEFTSHLLTEKAGDQIFACPRFGFDSIIFNPMALNLDKKVKKEKSEEWVEMENDPSLIQSSLLDLIGGEKEIQEAKNKLAETIEKLFADYDVFMLSDLFEALNVNIHDFWLYWQICYDNEFLSSIGVQYERSIVNERIVKTLIHIPTDNDVEIYSVDQLIFTKRVNEC